MDEIWPVFQRTPTQLPMRMSNLPGRPKECKYTLRTSPAAPNSADVMSGVCVRFHSSSGRSRKYGQLISTYSKRRYFRLHYEEVMANLSMFVPVFRTVSEMLIHLRYERYLHYDNGKTSLQVWMIFGHFSSGRQTRHQSGCRIYRPPERVQIYVMNLPGRPK